MKHSDAEIQEAAKSCSTRLEFSRKHKNLCEAARHRGLLASIYQWLPESDQRYTPEEIFETVKTCKTRTEWQRKYSGQYGAAVRLGIMDKIHELVPNAPTNVAAYSVLELADTAKSFYTRAEWEAYGKQEMEQGKVSSYNCALQRHHWIDSELVEAASYYQHKNDWKRSKDARHSAAYQAARTRPELFKQATAHMTPKANPFAGDYIIYVFEFADHHAYVGLTFQPKDRLSQHLCRGPVFNHIAVCPDYSHKVLAAAIGSPAAVIDAEKVWIERYRQDGWTMLNTSTGGSLGTLVRDWTKELIIAEARKFATKQAWIDGSQGSYRKAKREGWFEEACAHMPRRKLGVGVGRTVSQETRQRQREAKLGVTQSPEHLASRSEAGRRW